MNRILKYWMAGLLLFVLPAAVYGQKAGVDTTGEIVISPADLEHLLTRIVLQKLKYNQARIARKQTVILSADTVQGQTMTRYNAVTDTAALPQTAAVSGKKRTDTTLNTTAIVVTRQRQDTGANLASHTTGYNSQNGNYQNDTFGIAGGNTSGTVPDKVKNDTQMAAKGYRKDNASGVNQKATDSLRTAAISSDTLKNNAADAALQQQVAVQSRQDTTVRYVAPATATVPSNKSVPADTIKNNVADAGRQQQVGAQSRQDTTVRYVAPATATVPSNKSVPADSVKNNVAVVTRQQQVGAQSRRDTAVAYMAPATATVPSNKSVHADTVRNNVADVARQQQVAVPPVQTTAQNVVSAAAGYSYNAPEVDSASYYKDIRNLQSRNDELNSRLQTASDNNVKLQQQIDALRNELGTVAAQTNQNRTVTDAGYNTQIQQLNTKIDELNRRLNTQSVQRMNYTQPQQPPVYNSYSYRPAPVTPVVPLTVSPSVTVAKPESNRMVSQSSPITPDTANADSSAADTFSDSSAYVLNDSAIDNRADSGNVLLKNIQKEHISGSGTGALGAPGNSISDYNTPELGSTTANWIELQQLKRSVQELKNQVQQLKKSNTARPRLKAASPGKKTVTSKKRPARSAVNKKPVKKKALKKK